MEFKNNETKDELNFIESQFKTEPCANVISKEDFNERITKVFNILWEKLVKSFGPAGAGTFISIYPSYYNTKDGFTIMKNIAFDLKLDQVICDMVMEICSRLNFTVGDGTTTAVIATKSTYDAYKASEEQLKSLNILPRDILKKFDYIKNDLIKKIEAASFPIRSEDPEKLYENIKQVVYISSNGNEEITEMIASLYKELMYPAITCAIAKDGVTKSSIISGYKIDVSLTDKLYINNDNNTMVLDGSDVIMFDHKVTKDTYEYILRPLSFASKQRGRHLVCIAPYYDETALNSVIKTDLNKEYKSKQDINLVLTVCSRVTGDNKVLMNDLAMLLNTMLISPATENDIINIAKKTTCYDVFDLDNRGIEGINVAVWSEGDEDNGLVLRPYDKSLKNIFNSDNENALISVGYCDSLNIGLKETTFAGFYYDESVYNKYMAVAKSELAEIQEKCRTMGAFSLELIEKQKRVYTLGLKTGIIEVGSTSELSQGYLKDTVDDAVKAAASAYNNGVVYGCNLTTIRCIYELLDPNNENYDNIDRMLLQILLVGYISVYSSVLSNAFPSVKISEIKKLNEPDEEEKSEEDIRDENGKLKEEVLMEYMDILKKANVIASDQELDDDICKNANMIFDMSEIHACIIGYSFVSGMPYDISTKKFSNEIINSSETDKEILKATIDLLSLLITGNQLVLR